MKIFHFISPLLLFLAILPVRADHPTDRVRSTADKILGILNNSTLQGDQKRTERRRQIRLELDARFDWQGIAKTSLGRHWAKLQPNDQKEFVAVFSQFLEESYLDKFEPYYKDLDHIDYKGERLIDNFASVKTMVTTKEQIQHPVEYRLLKPAGDGDWRVYDVVIEGVSMVNNYRVQFDDILAKGSFEKLMADLRSKIPASPH